MRVRRGHEFRGESKSLDFSKLRNVRDDRHASGCSRLEYAGRTHVSDSEQRNEDIGDGHDACAFGEGQLPVKKRETIREPFLRDRRLGSFDVSFGSDSSTRQEQKVCLRVLARDLPKRAQYLKGMIPGDELADGKQQDGIWADLMLPAELCFREICGSI